MPKREKNLPARKPPQPLDAAGKLLFLERYRETGLIYLAAELSGVSVSTIHANRKKDPVFDEMCHEAKETHTDMLIQEATRRAMEGVEEPIIGGKDRDQIVATKVVYSDKLMELLIRGQREEYRNQSNVTANNFSSGVLVIPEKQASIEDWQEKYGEVLPK